MKKTERLNQLFKEWQAKYPCYKDRFVKDGIIDEYSWESGATRKILFLLKDTNDNYYQRLAPEKRKAYQDDMRKMLSDAPWKEIGYLSYGLQHTTKTLIPSFDDAVKNMAEACRQSSVMNLKKVPGKSYANPKEILEFVRQQKEEIEKEIEIISPEVIVAGGVGELLRKVFAHQQLGEKTYSMEFGGRSFVIVESSHPQARRSRSSLYQELCAIFQRHLADSKS